MIFLNKFFLGTNVKRIIKIVPEWLYFTLANFYWMLHPHRRKVLLFPLVNHWIAIDNGLQFRFLKIKKEDKADLIEDWIFGIAQPYEFYFEVKPGYIIFDIGANVGENAIPWASKVGKKGIVVAIEPNPVAIKYLKKNIKINNLQNVKVVEKALWNCKCLIKLNKGLWVQADTLDNIFSELGVNRVDFLKMDIEGAELEALEGTKDSLNAVKKIVIEASHIRNNEKTVFNVCQFLKSRGFSIRVDSEDYVYAWKA